MEKKTEKRVVSARTKRLFVAFGAASIATIAIVYWTTPDGQSAQAAPAPKTVVQHVSK